MLLIDMYTKDDFKVGMIVKYINIREDINGFIGIVIYNDGFEVKIRRKEYKDSNEHYIDNFSIPIEKNKIQIIG